MQHRRHPNQRYAKNLKIAVAFIPGHVSQRISMHVLARQTNQILAVLTQTFSREHLMRVDFFETISFTATISDASSYEDDSSAPIQDVCERVIFLNRRRSVGSGQGTARGRSHAPSEGPRDFGRKQQLQHGWPGSPHRFITQRIYPAISKGEISQPRPILEATETGEGAGFKHLHQSSRA
jgi:hypothetical protein